MYFCYPNGTWPWEEGMSPVLLFKPPLWLEPKPSRGGGTAQFLGLDHTCVWNLNSWGKTPIWPVFHTPLPNRYIPHPVVSLFLLFYCILCYLPDLDLVGVGHNTLLRFERLSGLEPKHLEGVVDNTVFRFDPYMCLEPLFVRRNTVFDLISHAFA